MLHFAQMGIALTAAGAAVMLIAGLVRETLQEGGRNFHLFPDAHDPPEMPPVKVADTVRSNDAGPFPRSGANDARCSNSDLDVEDPAPRGQRKKKRRNKKRKGVDGGNGRGRQTAAEAETA